MLGPKQQCFGTSWPYSIIWNTESSSLPKTQLWFSKDSGACLLWNSGTVADAIGWNTLKIASGDSERRGGLWQGAENLYWQIWGLMRQQNVNNSFTQSLRKIHIFSFQQTIICIFLFLWVFRSMTKKKSRQFLFWGTLGRAGMHREIRNGEHLQQ